MAQAETTGMASEWGVALDGILADCQKPGWDSYGADPVTQTVVDTVRRLVDSLHITPTVHGGIAVFMANEGISFEFDQEGMLNEVYASRSDVDHWYVMQQRAAAADRVSNGSS